VLGPDFVANEIIKEKVVSSKEALEAVGIIGRAFDQMNKVFTERRQKLAKIEVCANYYEIYNEKIFDLLSPRNMEE